MNTCTPKSDPRRPAQLLLPLAVFLLSAFSACVPHHRLVNFEKETSKGDLQTQFLQEPQELRIQSDDILAIRVYSLEPDAAKPFNISVNDAFREDASGGDELVAGAGYLVDNEGYIEFPVLGKVKVAGLTRKGVKDTLKTMLSNYLVDPVVEVRFLNMHVSVLGEVNVPGIYTFPDEQFTVLEAISLAGDLTDYADRERIMVIRESNDIREFGRIDLSTARSFESPYFYLLQNDVVYVPPYKGKGGSIDNTASRIIMLSSPFISLATAILVIVLN